MTGAHIFYIPMIAIAGIVIGFVLGKRATLAELERQARREQRRAARAQRDG